MNEVFPASTPDRPPAPLWRSVPAIGFQGCGMFLLPYAVGFVAAMFLEVSEVVETAVGMAAFTAVAVVPVSLAQLFGVILKSARELRYWHRRGALGAARVADVIVEHISVVTLRGWVLLLSGVTMTVIALAARWASFGLVAVLALLMFYLVTGWTVFSSALLIRSFEQGMARHGAITRRFVPTVAEAGATVEEVFTLRNVPLPWGYLLLIEDRLPNRLHTESRYVIGNTRGTVECRGLLRSTPRGHYFLGPARIWYQDILGITQVSVAALATAELKVLPRMRAVEVVEPPKTPHQAPDVLSQPHRSATEDHFRFREYASGDDTRRIHWRLSLRSGHLQVRRPESRELHTQQVVLVLDTYLPPGADRDGALAAEAILDGLAEAWLGVARALVDSGDRVTLVAAVGQTRDAIAVERLDCSGDALRWRDLAARSRWQGQFDLPELLAECSDVTHAAVVTARLTAAPPGPLPGRTTTWLFMDPAEALPPSSGWLNTLVGGEDAWSTARWLLQLPYPTGAEDNALFRRWAETIALWRIHRAQRRLRRLATERAVASIRELTDRGDTVYRIDRTKSHVRLVRQATSHRPRVRAT